MLPIRLFWAAGLFFVWSVCATAQWSTSTVAESTLYVCPGFYPGIVTFDDGSSIVLGALESYIFAQKLDEYGYAQWSQPVLVHQDFDSFITDEGENWGGWVSDGDGGVFLFWYDHRDAYFDSGRGEWLNNAICVQRVDQLGNSLWQSGGIIVEAPSSGLKKGSIISDSENGCILAWTESEFDFPGAGDIERARVVRISGSGDTMWDARLDSSIVQYSLSLFDLGRTNSRVILSTSVGNRIVNIDGSVIQNHPLDTFGVFETEGDSVLYFLSMVGERIDSLGRRFFIEELTKYDADTDSLWTAMFEIEDEAGVGGYYSFANPLVTDGIGGCYFVWGYYDTEPHTKAERVDQSGATWGSNRVHIVGSQPRGTFGGASDLGIVAGFNSSLAQRYDSDGTEVWPSSVHLFSDPENVYFDEIASDNNGGAIVVYWTTFGGIFAQHTGRNGQIGVITSIGDSDPIPSAAKLYQNYPNPFNPTTTIRYELPERSEVSLKMYDILGQEVRSLIESLQEAGDHEVALDATHLATGVYFYRLTAGSFSDVKKLVVVK